MMEPHIDLKMCWRVEICLRKRKRNFHMNIKKNRSSWVRFFMRKEFSGRNSQIFLPFQGMAESLKAKIFFSFFLCHRMALQSRIRPRSRHYEVRQDWKSTKRRRCWLTLYLYWMTLRTCPKHTKVPWRQHLSDLISIRGSKVSDSITVSVAWLWGRQTFRQKI